MLKLNSEKKLEGTNLLIVFPGEGNSTDFALSLLLSNYNFEKIGYLYSDYIKHSVSYLENGNLEFNGDLYLNEEKKLTILNLTSGAPKKFIHKFNKEMVEFIKNNKFNEIYILSSSSNDNITDIDIKSKIINIYYESNIENFNGNGMKKIKEAFNVNDEKRKGKKYYELSLISCSNSSLQLTQKLILEKINFVFIFNFSNDILDPLSGFALYKKILFLFKLSDKDENVEKNEMNALDALIKIEKENVKISPGWKILLIE